ncbi:hypothetical protein QBC40DRAFT_330129 [Triangularia verruculosa]|uniref:Uncharacterized protein n=1 Tax=Triangularia verruculosa TaxID=2587418 RepID=A0AAN6XDY1_9PEZI|nr:hypothetical protein QBC40DRAFT_330129 [Triangularia verruculosa]
MQSSFFVVLALTARVATALPQAVTPSPTGQACSTRTRTQLGIEATITNYPEFLSSMDQHWSTSEVPFSGTDRVVVYTSLETFDGGSFTGYYTYDIHALRSAGYSITTSTQEIVSCTPTSGSSSSVVGECEPHGGHWHCPPGVPEPTTPPSLEPTTAQPVPSTGKCEPHGDHWHCPPGVAEPTNPPSPSSTGDHTAPSTGECEPHGDHWHCPPGVAEPTAPPPSSPAPQSTTSRPEECEPHGDHWHCPDGMPGPTTPLVSPSVTLSPASLSSGTASASFTRTASVAPVVTAGADAKTGAGMNLFLLAAAVPFALGMI